MKPAPFGYLAPRSVDETLELMASHGDDAKVIAGGQSLGPLLNLRLATPAMVIDLNRILELAGISAHDGDGLTIGAMTRQHDAETSPAVAAACPLLAEALPYVAHRTIRNRGTIGGSLAHSDPAAELPAVVTAVRAEMVIRSRSGERTIPAEEFFLGYFTAALEPDELLVAVRVPAVPARTTSAWQEFATRSGDYAIVGVAAVIGLDGAGVVDRASIVCSGIADVPRQLSTAQSALVGQEPTSAVIAAAVAAQHTDPPADLVGSSSYRRHLVGVLAQRALEAATERQEGNDDRPTG
ncbi:MAG: xanthine dehydrogenase family protein subunit M [Propionibacteriales bacterium]|nr:xanthine dehydrogenase family protein subunit M [Propionibacteriales bacterium]